MEGENKMEEQGFYAFDDMLFPEVGTEAVAVSADKPKAGTLDIEGVVNGLKALLASGCGDWERKVLSEALRIIESDYPIDCDPYEYVPEGRGVCLTLVRPDLQPKVREEDQMRLDIHTVHKWTGRIRSLEARVTELLASNNRLVDERRAMAVERDAARAKLATLHKYAKGFVEAMGDEPEGDEEEFLAIVEGLRAALVDSEEGAQAYEQRVRTDERERTKTRRNVALKNGYVAVDAYTNGKVIVVEGDPKEDDQAHNCDALGCGLAHVMYRVEIPEWQRRNEGAQECEEDDCQAAHARTTADGVRLCEACWNDLVKGSAAIPDARRIRESMDAGSRLTKHRFKL